jgi:hypothetical protein
MKRKICFGLIFALCLFTLSKVSTQSQEALVNINKIYVQTGELKVKIVLETDAPLPLLKTYYSKESPQTIVTEWDKIKAIKEPSFSPEESPLIQSLNVERMNENQLRFLLNLKEQVPYRVLSDKKSTTIELIKIQRSLGKYPIDAETEKSLQEKGKVKTKLNKVDFSEKEDKIDVIIKTSNNPVPNVFAMANIVWTSHFLLHCEQNGSKKRKSRSISSSKSNDKPISLRPYSSQILRNEI